MSSNKMDLTATRRLPRQDRWGRLPPQGTTGWDDLRLCYHHIHHLPHHQELSRLNEDTLVLIRVLLYRDLLIRWQVFNLNRKQRIIRSGKMSSLRWFMAPQIRHQKYLLDFLQLAEVHQTMWVPGDSHLWLRSVWLPSFLNWSKNVNFDFYWS